MWSKYEQQSQGFILLSQFEKFSLSYIFGKLSKLHSIMKCSPVHLAQRLVYLGKGVVGKGGVGGGGGGYCTTLHLGQIIIVTNLLHLCNVDDEIKHEGGQ